MHDLFGDPIAEQPVTPDKASSTLGRRRRRETFSIPYSEPKEPVAPVDEYGALILPPLREAVQEYVDEHGLACVDVTKVKQEYFRDAELRAFDFVVHIPEQPSLLVLAGDTCDAAKQDLREWERVFGLGFVGVVAEHDQETGALRFRTLDGERLELP